MIYLTGDTHRNFERIYQFCRRHNTSRAEDLMIILGDAGLNYYGKRFDDEIKRKVSTLPITFLCVHGNHEMRPQSVEGYITRQWCGGFVMFEPEFPNILFAIDGEIYDLNGLSTMVVGGAYSVDKEERLEAQACGFEQYKWFADEQPDTLTKLRCEQALARRGHKVDVLLSHTCPFNDRPVEAFLPGVDQSTVDTTTEEWLQKLVDHNDVKVRFSGHYHVDGTYHKSRILYKDIIMFPTKEELYGTQDQ